MLFSINRRQLGAALLILGTVAVAGKAHAGTLEDVKKKGVVVIGIQGDNPPWGYVDSSGKQDGIDADMGRAFAEYLGVKAEFVPLAVANRIPALTTGRVDILFATMAMLPERAKAVQYSKPYVANEITLVAAQATPISSNADMGKYVIGVPRSSTQDTQVTNSAPAGTEIRRFDDDAATIQALLSGQVQAVGANSFYPQRLNAAKPEFGFEPKLHFTALYNGACTRLGEKEWNETANKFIDQIKSNGKLAGFYAKWMKAPVPTFPDSVPGVPFTAQ
ncbi:MULTISPECIES: transporter substrate-binding domain-containing protein [Bradyrhizobium]|uniref:ABC transporter substrate-binding protein n=1 Tax=Bradyrhizobium zhanjiangense TaxID=1325107 RepID=A0A4Q0QJW3_9BRAD|nr:MULTISPECIES: transporter substrate-binding domain-containing protein [Bradyrhizobium]RXG91980.1 ABC transporter substrate-binding protein [Bradyrhizobium zhanjiangense]UQR61150.1 transporter substrate-binding domain-containing protein [Bradyrhizobium sp. C-145]